MAIRKKKQRQKKPRSHLHTITPPNTRRHAKKGPSSHSDERMQISKNRELWGNVARRFLCYSEEGKGGKEGKWKSRKRRWRRR